MVVVRHRPILTWGLRAVLVTGTVFGACWAYQYGYQTGANTQAELEQQLSLAVEQSARLSGENAELTQTIINAKMGAKVDRQANESVRQEVLELKAALQKAEEEKEIGRYQSILLQNKLNSEIYVMDTTNGQLVKLMNLENIIEEAEDNYGQIEGGVKF